MKIDIFIVQETTEHGGVHKPEIFTCRQSAVEHYVRCIQEQDFDIPEIVFTKRIDSSNFWSFQQYTTEFFEGTGYEIQFWEDKIDVTLL